ncbi:MAG: 6-carboxytetrahydropterin synthase [Planctomycetes bacterium]|nr:6-carboxytetrahydropterin synthase [Planctomycetota bacterium]
MPSVFLTRRYTFSSAHRLHSDALSAEENARLYGKCNNAHGHGHNYAVEVTVTGAVDPRTGFCCDLPALDAAVKRSVLDRFDHNDLNALPEFARLVPTGESIARLIWDKLKAEGIPLDSVRLQETRDNFFEYRGER